MIILRSSGVFERALCWSMDNEGRNEAIVLSECPIGVIRVVAWAAAQTVRGGTRT